MKQGEKKDTPLSRLYYFKDVVEEEGELVNGSRVSVWDDGW